MNQITTAQGRTHSNPSTATAQHGRVQLGRASDAMATGAAGPASDWATHVRRADRSRPSYARPQAHMAGHLGTWKLLTLPTYLYSLL
jgi:hypothetical protein